MSTYLLVAVLALAAGIFMGNNYAHHLIAEECARLGGFFVGKRVFKCVEIETLPSAVRGMAEPPPRPQAQLDTSH